jgi:hypothetical protein
MDDLYHQMVWFGVAASSAPSGSFDRFRELR